jgi:uncharacterized protein
MIDPKRVLLLPGWQNSGPEHWQSRWERAYGYVRVEQHDWERPLRGDWIARLEEVLLARQQANEDAAPALLVAHSLGCIMAAAWAAHSQNTQLVGGALLVAPPDVEREEIGGLLPGWAPIPLQKMPFPSVLVASSNDPFCRLEKARALAAAWGSERVETGPRGHLNSESGLGDWPEAHDALGRLAGAPPSRRAAS